MAVKGEEDEEEGFVAVDVLLAVANVDSASVVSVVALKVDVVVVVGLMESVVGSEGSKARRCCVVEEEECVEEVEDWEDEIWMGEAAEE